MASFAAEVVLPPPCRPANMITVGPGETRPFEDVFPPMTTHVGLVAEDPRDSLRYVGSGDAPEVEDDHLLRPDQFHEFSSVRIREYIQLIFFYYDVKLIFAGSDLPIHLGQQALGVDVGGCRRGKG